MSEILTNKLTGTSTAGSILVTGEGNSTTTNLQQGLAKVWINFTGITTTASRDSFNVSSLTDDATARTTISISSSMANGNYSGSYFQNGAELGGATNFNNDFAGGFQPRATGSYAVYSYGTSAIDAFYNDSVIVGDLA
jgi:hypothetical protein